MVDPVAFEALLVAYRQRFHDDPPMFDVDREELMRRIPIALRTGRPITEEDFGLPDGAYAEPNREEPPS